VHFLYDGKWHSVVIAKTPRTAFLNNYLRQSMMRVIRQQGA
jgi:hypothetical protein